MSGIWIGTSGWSYDHWDGVLYGPTLPPADRLHRYVQEFDTVELNASFYRWPRDADLPRLAPTAATRVPDEREGSPWPEPRSPVASARTLDPPTGGLLARAGGPSRCPAGPAATRSGSR